MRLIFSSRRSLCLATAAVALLGAACSTPSTGGGTGGTGGGPVSGTPDAHCSAIPAQATSQSVCHLTSDAGPGDAGAGDAGTGYGDTMFDSEGDDDDCKYHVKWSSTPVGEDRDVTFTLILTTKSDGKPAGASTGLAADANIYADVTLSDTHPAPPTKQASTETAPGTYTVGPIRFDAAGKWTVRFHFYESCTDVAPDSPHGHAAFFVQVP